MRLEIILSCLPPRCFDQFVECMAHAGGVEETPTVELLAAPRDERGAPDLEPGAREWEPRKPRARRQTTVLSRFDVYFNVNTRTPRALYLYLKARYTSVSLM